MADTMIKRLHIQGFKSLQDVTVELGQVNENTP